MHFKTAISDLLGPSLGGCEQFSHKGFLSVTVIYSVECIKQVPACLEKSLKPPVYTTLVLYLACLGLSNCSSLLATRTMCKVLALDSAPLLWDGSISSSLGGQEKNDLRLFKNTAMNTPWCWTKRTISEARSLCCPNWCIYPIFRNAISQWFLPNFQCNSWDWNLLQRTRLWCSVSHQLMVCRGKGEKDHVERRQWEPQEWKGSCSSWFEAQWLGNSGSDISKPRDQDFGWCAIRN